MLWLSMAFLSALFAGITSILAKCGIKKMDSDVATGLRTVVVLIFAWIMVMVVGSANSICNIGIKSMAFLMLSGIATGASWIFYFKALSLGDVNKVVPIDKSSTIMTVLLAIVCFGETGHIAAKLIGTMVLGIGIFLMIEKKQTEKVATGNKWKIYAVLSAIFAALTSILAKVGMDGVESNLATAIRTSIVLIMSWLIVFIKGKQSELRMLDRKELVYVSLSGIATGGSWLCYFYAIKNGIVSVVVPIDKMSILVTVLFSYIVFKEKLSLKATIGLVMMVFATIFMAIYG